VGPVERTVWDALVALTLCYSPGDPAGWRTATAVGRAAHVRRRQAAHFLRRFEVEGRCEGRAFAFLAERAYRPVDGSVSPSRYSDSERVALDG
jgi:hypothetical protein